ncbi:MAG: patatin-like phospholipase family protein [Clostridia bacterium]|nr:patatin-like phospholipase family protein [Clostridia bacterium]
MFFSWLFKRKKKKNIKLGLALGSGGAKGFAELGALTAFEENGIVFDVIAGTSIGSIIGAFYADGYTAKDIAAMITSAKFSDIISGMMINMDYDGLFRVLDRELGGLNYSELKKPFKCVATEYDSGNERVFDSGNVAITLCASSCFYPYFKPVYIDGITYVDGAYVNSIPADCVREMGADYVVGIDLSVRDAKPSILTKMLPSYDKKVPEPWKKGYDNSDVVIHPDLSEFKSTSMSGGKKMFEIGYRAAMEVMDKIKADVDNLKNGKKK